MNQRDQALTEQRERIMSQAERKIWVTFRKEGIHCYLLHLLYKCLHPS